MSNYKDFGKVYIGSSDIASLVFRSVSGTKEIHFGGDGCYDAYEVFGNDVEIGAHYKKVFTGDTWLWIYDDTGRTYDSRYHDGMTVDVYRAAGYGCIIHWHSEDPKVLKCNIVQAEDIAFKVLGTWPGAWDIDVVKLKDGRVFALHGWNGEKYTDCWECFGESWKPSKERYTLKPVHRYDAYNIDLGTIDECSDEWDKAIEVVDYAVTL